MTLSGRATQPPTGQCSVGPHGPRLLELTGSRPRQARSLGFAAGSLGRGLPLFAVPRVPAFPQIPVPYGSDSAVRSLLSACVGSLHLLCGPESLLKETLCSCLVLVSSLTNGARRLSGPRQSPREASSLESERATETSCEAVMTVHILIVRNKAHRAWGGADCAAVSPFPCGGNDHSGSMAHLVWSFCPRWNARRGRQLAP